ncbi:uncharacterized protein LOC125469850 isoform X2 [Pyrus x bretschneideri]|uniref:uncharacterized protein LOC125469850 isoform X2 n=1 Tax=Pyrus x bretschneideri TaxID=225117 RepID=UPI00202E3F0A|nr:uncharacterized protein LOC125469850 isoform X2 [Pyrus x bretschneideri]
MDMAKRSRGCNSPSSQVSAEILYETGSHDHEEAEDQMMDLRRGPWTVEEDLALMNYIANHGEGRWNSLARCAVCTVGRCLSNWFCTNIQHSNTLFHPFSHDDFQRTRPQRRKKKKAFKLLLLQSISSIYEAFMLKLLGSICIILPTLKSFGK